MDAISLERNFFKNEIIHEIIFASEKTSKTESLSSLIEIYLIVESIEKSARVSNAAPLTVFVSAYSALLEFLIACVASLGFSADFAKLLPLFFRTIN